MSRGYPHFDLFFLSYGESNAEIHWQQLYSRFPKAKRLHGICGLKKAHSLLAQVSETDFYFVIDADNQIEDNFSFDVPFTPQKNTLYVWRAKNPVNDLVYGYGGVKLYNRTLFANHKSTGADLATTIAPRYEPVMICASTTHFNATPLESWRGAFRECAKLTQNVIKNPADKHSQSRLSTWLSTGAERKNGLACLAGAKEGHLFAQNHQHDSPSMLLINNFDWLNQQFSKSIYC